MVVKALLHVESLFHHGSPSKSAQIAILHATFIVSAVPIGLG